MTIPDTIISAYKRSTLSSKERHDMRSRLHAYARSNPAMPGFFSRTFMWARQHRLTAVLSAAVLVGGATGVSAHYADPGDALYTFRVEVNDRLQTSLIRDDDKRFDAEVDHLQRMIDDEDGVRDHELSSSIEIDEAADLDDDSNEGIERELEDVQEHLQLEDDARVELD